MPLPSIKNQEIKYGTRVLVRASLNAPIVNNKVESNFRLIQTARTIKYLQELGARVTVIGHLGREGDTLFPIHVALNKIIPISFIKEIIGEIPYAAKNSLSPGEAILLENIRIDHREMEKDILFIEELSYGSDIFVFDDFSSAHRNHASTTGLIESLPSFTGISFYEEVTALARITKRLHKPAIAILGGAKCKTKIPIIKNLLKTYNSIHVTGVIANTLLKQKGYEIGKSVVEDADITEDILNNKKIILPNDVLVIRENGKTIDVQIEDIKKGDAIVDIGIKTLKSIMYKLNNSKTVLWNGPTGWYQKGYTKNTLVLANLINKDDIYSFVGGGDTVSILEKGHMLNKFNFVSTGGGAFLEYMAHENLPVLEAFSKKFK